MEASSARNKVVLEIMLMIVAVGITVLFLALGGARLVVLNLFYLPVVLSGYFHGRTRACGFALFAALIVTIATLLAPDAPLASFSHPLLLGLALLVWSACLGMTALLIGTLCDEHNQALAELQKAYVGVAEVLSRYLQGAVSNHRPRSMRVAELSQRVAEKLRLAPKQVDDIRVAALLHDLESVEVTTEFMTNAVDRLEHGPFENRRARFRGTDLVHSLAAVLDSALPLLAHQDEAVSDNLAATAGASDAPLGAHIIRAARRFDQFAYSADGEQLHPVAESMRLLRASPPTNYGHVLDALESVVTAQSRFVSQNAASTAAGHRSLVGSAR